MSEAPYEALDFALLRDPERLRENQRRLGLEVGFDPARLYQTKQVHGRVVLTAEGDPVAFAQREADAIAAGPGSGVAVAVRVADCVPVLLADATSGAVVAVHAGWRGVVAEVIGAAMATLDPSRTIAAIGPSIGPCCFEVGEDVGAQIVKATTPQAIARRDEARGKVFVDLRAGVRAQLGTLGVANDAIEDVPGCTRCDAARFYSFRRDGDTSGRLMGVIVAR
ncbi:MAG: laccase domain-containing protein [Deltaproteobacteria bacterium]|nr:laccase domain-containing protein [Deltaproteobacteria bacterium]